MQIKGKPYLPKGRQSLNESMLKLGELQAALEEEKKKRAIAERHVEEDAIINKGLRQWIDQFSIETEGYKQELASLRSISAEKDAQITFLTSKLAIVEEENISLKQRITKLEEEKKVLENDKNKLKEKIQKQIQQLEEERSDWAHEVVDIDQINDQLILERDKYKRKLESKQTKLEELQKKFEAFGVHMGHGAKKEVKTIVWSLDHNPAERKLEQHNGDIEASESTRELDIPSDSFSHEEVSVGVSLASANS